MELLTLAFKNITRNLRRTFLNISALVVGISMLVLAVGWIRGYFTTLYQGMIRFDTGHIQVLHRHWLEREIQLPLDRLVDPYDQYKKQIIDHMDWVEVVSGRIDFPLRLGDGVRSSPALGRAIDPEYEKEITLLSEHITQGSWLESEEEGVLIGHGIAQKFELVPGDNVYLRLWDRFSAPNLAALPVKGIFRLGYPVMDENLVVLSLSAAAPLLRTGTGVTRLVITTDGSLSPEKGAELLNQTLDDTLQAYPWKRFAETMVMAVKADSGAFAVLMVIFTLLIVLNLLNSMSMTVRERSREIGAMRAFGMNKGTLKRLLFAESLCLSLVASIMALLFTGIVAYYLQFHGVDIGQVMPEELPIPFGDRFYADFRWYDFFGGAIFSTGTAMLGTLIPANRAAKVSVAKTMSLRDR